MPGSLRLARATEGVRALLPNQWERALVLCIAMLVVLTIYKVGLGATKYAAKTDFSFSYPWAVLMVLATTSIAVWNRHITFDEVWSPLRFMIRAAGFVIFLQVCFDAFYPTSWVSNLLIGQDDKSRLLIGLAFLTGLASIWRPSFLLALGVSYFAFRYYVPQAYGLSRTSLDFQVLADAFTFPAAAIIAWSVMARLKETIFPNFTWLDECQAGQNAKTWQQTVWAVVVGTHLGNYFHSALAKVHVGGPEPLFWLFENPTQNTLSLGLFRYNNPIAGYPELVQAVYEIMAAFVVPMNVAVFLIQLLAPIAPAKRRLLIIFTLAFDLLHLGIYLSLGVFFLFWIAINIIILVSLARIPRLEYTNGMRLSAIVSCCLGWVFFYQAQLGWLDGRKVVRQNFYAITSEGQQVLVPPATFSLYSYQMSHADLYVPSGHYLIRHGGNATFWDWEEASQCTSGVEPEQVYGKGSIENLNRMVSAADQNLRQNPWLKELGLFYFYPHHSPSNPAFFAEYNALAMDEIVRYMYVIESACLDLQNGRLANDVRVRTEILLGDQ